MLALLLFESQRYPQPKHNGPKKTSDETYHPSKRSTELDTKHGFHLAGFRLRQTPKIWNSICRNWISFLSATSSTPKLELAPRRKVIIWGLGDSESPQAHTKRFREDRVMRRRVQAATWLKLDGLEVLAERWPVLVRSIINEVGLKPVHEPFQSWVAKVGLSKRRRGNSMWTALVCFLIHSYGEGTLQEKGLALSEERQDDIMDVIQAAAMFRHTGANEEVPWNGAQYRSAPAPFVIRWSDDEDRRC